MVARAITSTARRENPREGELRRALNLLESGCSATCATPSPARCNKKEGKFALADGGSIFLDEIGTMAPPAAVEAAARAGTQFEPARLRAQPQGGRARHRRDQSRHPAMVSAGQFRRISHRLNVIPIHMLRETSAARRSLRAEARAASPASASRGLEPGVLDALQAADWPGNVRELETRRRAVVLSRQREDRPRGRAAARRRVGAAGGLPSRSLRRISLPLNPSARPCAARSRPPA
jgi:transcriptional regulator with AAA-type ATPase domain